MTDINENVITDEKDESETLEKIINDINLFKETQEKETSNKKMNNACELCKKEEK